MAYQWTYDIGPGGPPGRRAPPEELPPVDDLDRTGPGEACPLVQSMFPHHAERFDTLRITTSLVKAEANPNQSSIHANGFTPLMCAAGDAYEPDVFTTVLGAGADRGAVGRLSPEGSKVTLLQSLFSGSPPRPAARPTAGR